jgi:hypothetical protein
MSLEGLECGKRARVIPRRDESQVKGLGLGCGAWGLWTGQGVGKRYGPGPALVRKRLRWGGLCGFS